MALVVQVKKYPYTKGSKSQSVIIKEDDMQKVVLNIKKIYDELENKNEATITFYRL